MRDDADRLTVRRVRPGAPEKVNVRATVVDFRGHRYTMVPGWRAWLFGEEPGADVEMAEVAQPHADDGTIPWLTGWDASVVHEGGAATFSTYHKLGTDPTPFEVAVSVATGQLEAFFHEVMEWTTVDGAQIAEPHPTPETNWGWVHERMRAMVQDYAAEFPADSR